MPNSGLRGPYPLTKEKIDAVISKTSAGAYALGKTGTDDVFYIARVGRSDNDVNARLKCHVGDYNEFKFEYYASAKAAFEKECNLYHDFGPPDNKIHPDRPEGTTWSCPIVECDVLE